MNGNKPVGSKIHMAIPDGFEFLHPEIDKEKFYLLGRDSINGVKQSGHDFNKQFDRILKYIGFRGSQVDP